MTKRFRRAAAFLITLCVLLTLLPAALAAEGELTRAELAVLVYGKFQPEPPEEDPGFTDIGTCTEEQREAINALAGAGILDGRADGTFDPWGSVTRVQAALILWRALGQPAAGSEAPYADVPAHAEIAVNALYGRGILTEADAAEGKFLPDDPAAEETVSAWLARIDLLTRAEFARMVYEKFRPAALPPEGEPAREEDFPDIGPVEAGEKDPCTDAQRAAIAALYAAYILDGESDGRFHPGGAVTRAEAVVVLWRAAGRGDPAGSPSDIFNNVPENYRPAFNYLVSLGVLTGADAADGDFGLDVPASRADVERWLSRLLTRAELAELIAGKFELVPQEGALSPFIDIGECTADQQAAINALYQAGVLSGVQADRFVPNGPATCGAAAVALCRADSGDKRVNEVELALAYLESREVLSDKEAADFQPGLAATGADLKDWLARLTEQPEGGEPPETMEVGAASGDRLVVQVRLDSEETPEVIRILAARYDGGRMTAIDIVETTEEGLYLLVLLDGSGTSYRVFLLDGGQSGPLCPAAALEAAH